MPSQIATPVGTRLISWLVELSKPHQASSDSAEDRVPGCLGCLIPRRLAFNLHGRMTDERFAGKSHESARVDTGGVTLVAEYHDRLSLFCLDEML